MSKSLKWLAVFFVAVVAIFATLLLVSKDNGKTYRIKIEKNQGISAVSRRLAEDGVVFNRYVIMAAAYLTGVHNDLRAGSYRLPVEISVWSVLKKLRGGRPDSVTVRTTEEVRLADMRYVINDTEDIGHETRGWSNAKLMRAVAPEAADMNPEGLFFPDAHEIDTDSGDIQIYKSAYQVIQNRLKDAWKGRQDGLPYKTPYKMLIMASLIEKETAHGDGRAHVASVFVNRIEASMRLQTDPTVIYSVGDAYKGKIPKADLRRDTPYDTYTHDGLSPTSIALPGKAALEAAAHPSVEKYLYFVSKMDGTGLSRFSHALNEHSAAIRKYILKK